MPQAILDTLMAALDNYKGDPAEIEAARRWLTDFRLSYQENEEELAELQIVANEFDETAASGEINQMVDEMIEERKDKLV